MRLLIASLIALALLGGTALAVVEARFAAPSWAHDTVFEFGVYERGQRRATAYYRVLAETAEGETAFRFKYSGRNDSIAEASEVLVRAADMSPVYSTRKVVYNTRTFFQDIAYIDGLVRIRKRYEGEAVREHSLPAPAQVYDYEQLIWLIPLLDFGADDQARFDVFSNINELVTTVLVPRPDDETLMVQERGFPARVFTFNVGLTPYKYWLVMQNGAPVPGRIDMGGTSFINLKLDQSRITPFIQPRAATAPPPSEPEDNWDADVPEDSEFVDPDTEPDDDFEPPSGPLDPPPDITR